MISVRLTIAGETIDRNVIARAAAAQMTNNFTSRHETHKAHRSSKKAAARAHLAHDAGQNLASRRQGPEAIISYAAESSSWRRASFMPSKWK